MQDDQSAVYLAYTLGFGPITDSLVARKAAAFANSPFSPYANSSKLDGTSQKSDSISVRSRVFSFSAAGDEICPEIMVPRLTSFRSIQSIKSIQIDAIKQSGEAFTTESLIPSPFTTDSASTAAAYNQKPYKPIGKRLRKAAGKVIHMVLPRNTNNNN